MTNAANGAAPAAPDVAIDAAAPAAEELAADEPSDGDPAPGPKTAGASANQVDERGDAV
jgi:hypothetical protein